MLVRAIRAQEPIKLLPEDKLNVLRQLDRWRSWNSLHDKRFCLVCEHLITGREIEVVGGTRELGPLRLHCPTENCRSIPMDWVLPNDTQAAAAVSPAGALPMAQPTRLLSTRGTSLARRLRNVVGRIRMQSIRRPGKQKNR